MFDGGDEVDFCVCGEVVCFFGFLGVGLDSWYGVEDFVG